MYSFTYSHWSLLEWFIRKTTNAYFPGVRWQKNVSKKIKSPSQSDLTTYFMNHTEVL